MAHHVEGQLEIRCYVPYVVVFQTNIFFFFYEHSIGSKKKIDEQVRCIEEIHWHCLKQVWSQKTLKLMKRLKSKIALAF